MLSTAGVFAIDVARHTAAMDEALHHRPLLGRQPVQFGIQKLARSGAPVVEVEEAGDGRDDVVELGAIFSVEDKADGGGTTADEFAGVGEG